jgi:hypothetical protein
VPIRTNSGRVNPKRERLLESSLARVHPGRNDHRCTAAAFRGVDACRWAGRYWFRRPNGRLSTKGLLATSLLRPWTIRFRSISFVQTEIAAIYNQSPVAFLNRTLALAECEGPRPDWRRWTAPVRTGGWASTLLDRARQPAWPHRVSWRLGVARHAYQLSIGLESDPAVRNTSTVATMIDVLPRLT